MPQIHLIEGPVGSGKSTFANKLSQRCAAPHFNLDEWMARLFQPDRPATGRIEWYIERKNRCIQQIWQVSCGILAAGSDVILELGLIQRHSRQDFYKRLDEAGYKITVYVLDAPRDVRRERVQARNFEKGETFSMEVPDDIFEIASDMWEEPDDIECCERDVKFVSATDG